jgi:hypothetical protein
MLEAESGKLPASSRGGNSSDSQHWQRRPARSKSVSCVPFLFPVFFAIAIQGNREVPKMDTWKASTEWQRHDEGLGAGPAHRKSAIANSCLRSAACGRNQIDSSRRKHKSTQEGRSREGPFPGLFCVFLRSLRPCLLSVLLVRKTRCCGFAVQGLTLPPTIQAILRLSRVEKEVAFQRLVSYDGVVAKEYARMKENRT